ncbi:factor-independent urate hydroxylase [Kallotenue papyrolyticum]|uniref:factor-independent urate hydroxylase n=1 Tax=Kallotenue papyrolyticum TaxID=1325125 RepID=UPI00046F7761|nr:urate oxidase [Kallotenue papyrolyticum]
MPTTISYGKLNVPLYRTYARPLDRSMAVPESGFTGRSNVLFAAEIDVEVFGDNFLAAYTEGDNRHVVATDSMKNFILRQALAFEGATLEELIDLLGRRLLARYEVMQAVRVTGRALPFAPARLPHGELSDVLYRYVPGDYATASLAFERNGADIRLTDHECGWCDLRLLKVTGSAFTRFVRDEYTTLPERGDRPLFIRLDLHWRYRDVADMLDRTRGHYIAPEQMRDIVQTVFHEFVSESIQHLVYEIGSRVLRRCPYLGEVRFAAQNHTPDPVAESEDDPRVKVYSAPFPAFGLIKLRLAADEHNA